MFTKDHSYLLNTDSQCHILIYDIYQQSNFILKLVNVHDLSTKKVQLTVNFVHFVLDSLI